MFLDKDGNEWLESQLVAGLLGKPEPAEGPDDFYDVQLSRRELCTALAALRYWQNEYGQDGFNPADSVHFAEGVKPLSAEEIDALCERINTGG